MQLDIRMVESADAAEVYITAAPSPGARIDEQAETLFVAIRDVLERTDSRILAERIFAAAPRADELRAIRSRVYGKLDDGVPPAWLVVPDGVHGPLSGVVVHAVRTDSAPKVVQCDGLPCGRLLRLADQSLLNLTGISVPEADSPAEQTRGMLEKAEAVLRQSGGSMLSVARTWMWLGNILDWYDDFNRVRNQYFNECGLLNGQQPERVRLPASTGIGIGPASSAICSMDLVAVIGDEKNLMPAQVGGNQGSAFAYGSAFSRALKSNSPAGQTVFVSGTASVDAAGATEHVGNAKAQIDATIENVRAILRDTQSSDADIVQAIAYCKTAEIEKMFLANHPDFAWPCLTVIADVCRDDLLFEIEAVACPGARRM